MVALGELVGRYSDLEAPDRLHLRRLIASWSPLADLSLADLVLLLPIANNEKFVIAGQMRATTASTLYLDDQVGHFVEWKHRPVAVEALRTGEICKGATALGFNKNVTDVTAIPVNHNGKVIGVVVRDYGRSSDRLSSELELIYVSVFSRLAQMIADGVFPYAVDKTTAEESPRVGDGTIVLDEESKVVSASPNAISALRRIGYNGRIADCRLEAFGFDSSQVDRVFETQNPANLELKKADDVTIMAKVLPLVKNGKTTGSLVLIRDVTDLRNQERMLISMDATIREIHHRVKNNLQTVSSLLRLQGRRVESPEARAAIYESVRRIGAIAVVHEQLASTGGDIVLLADVLRPVMSMVQASLVPEDRGIRFTLSGSGPELSASKASSLAVIITELLQNAIEHGYPESRENGVIAIELESEGDLLTVWVRDDGVGLPAEFDIQDSSSLGLKIIQTLVSGELDGELEMFSVEPPESGTIAKISVTIAPQLGAETSALPTR